MITTSLIIKLIQIIFLKKKIGWDKHICSEFQRLFVFQTRECEKEILDMLNYTQNVVHEFASNF